MLFGPRIGENWLRVTTGLNPQWDGAEAEARACLQTRALQPQTFNPRAVRRPVWDTFGDPLA